jgi:hypothetical protein
MINKFKIILLECYIDKTFLLFETKWRFYYIGMSYEKRSWDSGPSQGCVFFRIRIVFENILRKIRRAKAGATRPVAPV